MSSKQIYFSAGLPRSGSTLLMNILGQNPRFHVTPTSGILDMLVQIRDSWANNAHFRARDQSESEQIQRQVLRAILQAGFEHVPQPVCFDKSRLWLDYLEMAAELLGGAEQLKVLVSVRDLRDVVASFEKLYRKTAILGQIPQEQLDPLRMKTAVGRAQIFIADDQPVGRSFNSIRDAATRGWLPCMHFIEYQALTSDPAATLAAVYEFLGEQPFAHDFEQVEQITHEDDMVHGFRDLHRIRPRVEPQPPSWPAVFDQTVLGHQIWRDIEQVAQFWRAYTA